MKFKRFRNGRCAVDGCYVRPKGHFKTCSKRAHRALEEQAMDWAIMINHSLHQGVASFSECPLCEQPKPVQLTLFPVNNEKVYLAPCNCTGTFSFQKGKS